jgi:general secretion pathway protein A
MYQKFYNLTKEPFHITSDPQFLYLSESHKQALASMVYGIEKRKGFVAITGGVGTGKTTVVRAYLDRARSADLKVIYLFQASMTFKELVRIIYQEFDLELTTSNLVDMVNGLHLALIEYYRQGKTVVIIIDEAQNMPVETLENLRMLSNLETPTEKLIQIVLVGQTELDELLEKHELRQLKQRIAIRSRILPLSAEESRAYIEHRLSVAGLSSSSIFDKNALDLIIKEADGVPRKLNILCDNALITGFGYQKNPVTASIAKEVISDFRSGRKKQDRTWRQRITLPIGLALFVALLIVLFLSFHNYRLAGLYGLAGFSGARKLEPMRDAADPAPQTKPEGEGIAYPPVRPPVDRPAEPAPVQQKSDGGEKIGMGSRGSIKPKYKSKIVRHGETLTNLMREAYGLGSSTIPDSLQMETVKKSNPAITNPNLIIAGSVVQFPDLPRGQR